MTNLVLPGMWEMPQTHPIEIRKDARATDPETSLAAAARDPEQRQRDLDQAWALLRSHPDGLTDFELADLMGRQQTSAGKRRGELRDRKLVMDSGRRRPAPSGSAAVVWVIVPGCEGVELR